MNYNDVSTFMNQLKIAVIDRQQQLCNKKPSAIYMGQLEFEAFLSSDYPKIPHAVNHRHHYYGITIYVVDADNHLLVY